MQLDLRQLFQDFNAAKFTVYFCLAWFSLLLALRLDGTIQWSFWAVFVPLWIWKVLACSGAIVGFITWFRNPQCRQDPDSSDQCRAMLISACLNMLLFIFELLACDKLDSGRQNHFWVLIFMPLFFLCIISIGMCVWAVKRQRSFEMELFFSVNILQFIFVALKLDNFINWNWVVLLVPLWILMCVSLVLVIYLIILAVILMRSSDIGSEQRHGSGRAALSYSVAIVLLLAFEIMLAVKLDTDEHSKPQAPDVSGSPPVAPKQSFSFTVVVIPLILTLFVLMTMTIGANRSSNHWWFGLRRDFCTFLLQLCPALREYGNVSYKYPTGVTASDAEQHHLDPESPPRALPTSAHSQRSLFEVACTEQPKPIVPVVSIYTPD